MDSNERIATVFGGTGFLGRRLVRAFAEAGFAVRIAARRPRAAEFHDIGSSLEHVEADVGDEEAVAKALEGATAAVNAVSLYEEKGELTFEAVHVDGAVRIARCCADAGVGSLVHISGIGSDPDSDSALIRAKAEGEVGVRKAFMQATIFRPSVLFGRDDAFLSGIKAASRPPVVPLFGRGASKLQPAWVRDVAHAAVQAVTDSEARGTIFELGGARVLTYRQAVEAVCNTLNRNRLLLPFPMTGWKMLVWAMQVLPNPPLNRDQLYLLAADNTASGDRPGFDDLDICPVSVLDKLDHCLK